MTADILEERLPFGTFIYILKIIAIHNTTCFPSLFLKGLSKLKTIEGIFKGFLLHLLCSHFLN